MASEEKGKNGRRTVCCRLCLSVNSLKKSIIVDAISEPLLVQKIYACVNVKIRAVDKYSTMVCTPCIDQINTWYAYKLTCLDNQMKLEKDLHYSEQSEPVDSQKYQLNSEINSLDLQIAKLMDSTDLDTFAANDENLPSSSTARDQHNDGMETGKKKFAGANNPEDDTTSSQTSTDSYMSSLEIRSIAEDHQKQCSEEKRAFLTEHLKLVARNSRPVEPPESLTKIEISYIEKCTAMDKMYRTLRCACHQASHPNLKSLFTHLRNSPLGFPSFTCYNCMITFPDRSSKTKHSFSECRKGKLETLTKLSELRQRSEIKTRIYQNYKCSECDHLYSFHEDFCAHVDESHCQSFAQPLSCSCDRVFMSLEEYKSHAYMSCLIEYYCDICSISVKTLDDFQKHAADCHDASEGFPIFQAYHYRQRPLRSRSSPLSGVKKNTYSKEAASLGNIIQTKRGRRASVYQLRKMKGYSKDKDVNETSPPKPIFQSTPNRVSARRKKTTQTLAVSENMVINPASVQKDASHICDVCGTKCSTGANLLKHSQTPTEETHPNETHTSGSHVRFHKNKDSKKSMKRKYYPTKQINKKRTQFHPEVESHKKVHLSNSTNEAAIVMCDCCDTTFVAKGELKKHKLIHKIMPVLEPSIRIDRKVPKSVERYDCNLCDKSYLSRSSHWKHTRKFHPGTKPNTYCVLCHKEFYRTRSYNSHKVVHQKLNNSVGPIGRHVREQYNAVAAGCSCSKQKTVPAKNNRPSWIKNKTEVKKPCVYPCSMCIETFSSRYELGKHKKTHTQEQTLANGAQHKFRELSFPTSDEHDNHVTRKHDEVSNQPDTPVVQYFCKQCQRVFNNRFALSAHGSAHKYSSVSNTSRTPKAKKRKLDVAKPATPLFKRGQCKATMPSDMAMQTHILEKHGTVDASASTSRSCICNLDFPSHNEYDQHKQLHTLCQKNSNQKKYSCKECSTVLTRNDDMDIHRRRFRDGEDQNVRVYKCTLCNRHFDKQYFLDIHLMVHQKQRVKKSKPKLPLATC